MATIKDNVDPKILKTLETSGEETTTKIIQESDLKKNKKTKKKEEKNVCCAAVHKKVLAEIWNSLQEKKDEIFYIITDYENSQKKEKAYIRCTKTVSDGKDYCHLHQRKFNDDKNSIKNFERDILPRGEDDEERRIATLEDEEFFEKMGTRGSPPKKNTGDLVIKKKDSFYPILKYFLEHKNARLRTEFFHSVSTLYRKYESERLKKKLKKVEEEEAQSEDESNDEFREAHFDEGSDEEEVEDEVDEDDEDDEFINIKKKKITKRSKSKSKSKRETNTVDSSDEEDEVDFGSDVEEKELIEYGEDAEDDGEETEILTSMNGKRQIYYYPLTQAVYELVGKENLVHRGKLFPSNKERATILYNGEYHITLSKFPHDGKIYYHSELDDKVYTENYELRGKVIYKNGKTFIEPVH